MDGSMINVDESIGGSQNTERVVFGRAKRVELYWFYMYTSDKDCPLGGGHTFFVRAWHMGGLGSKSLLNHLIIDLLFSGFMSSVLFKNIHPRHFGTWKIGLPNLPDHDTDPTHLLGFLW